MKTGIKPSISIGLKDRIDYGKLTLLQQIKRIVYKDDTEARDELHNRYILFDPLCKHGERLVERIARLGRSRLARRWCGGNQLFLDEATNLTLDKFFNISTRQSNCRHPKIQGSDCRYYFKAFITFAEKKLKAEPPANTIEAEVTLVKILLGLITWQFLLSCLEARRKEYKFARRYRWKLPEGDLYLWLPFEIPRQKCREWLEANIGEVDPRRHGEKARVQAIIDKLLSKRKIFFLSELYEVEEKLPPGPDPLASMIEDNISVEGLASAVADEKTENIEKQRRKIQLLGKEKLKKLIHTIFNALACGEYIEYRIAASYGLSSATFSRFAGAHWEKNCDEVNLVPPDLWVNVSHTLIGHSKFIMAAKKAGVLKRVREMLKTDQIREDSR